MGMFSETYAKNVAKSLSIMLYKGLKTKNEEVLFFCKECVYPAYKEQIGEAFIKIDPILLDAFEENEYI